MVYYGKLDERLPYDTSSPPATWREYKFHISMKYMPGYRFSDEEKNILRPIAETIALLSGANDYQLAENIYEQYLPEAATIYFNSAKPKHLSWLLDKEHESSAVEIAWKNWQTIKKLSKD